MWQKCFMNRDLMMDSKKVALIQLTRLLKKAMRVIKHMDRNCEKCIHKISKLSEYGEIYACERWICKPEYKDQTEVKDEIRANDH